MAHEQPPHLFSGDDDDIDSTFGDDDKSTTTLDPEELHTTCIYGREYTSAYEGACSCTPTDDKYRGVIDSKYWSATEEPGWSLHLAPLKENIQVLLLIDHWAIDPKVGGPRTCDTGTNGSNSFVTVNSMIAIETGPGVPGLSTTFVLATTRGSLPNELKPKPLPHTSYYSKTTINESPVNVTPTTVERSEKARLSVRPSSESCVAETPTNSPRDTLGDDGKGTLVADELEERLARIAAQAERNPKQSTHQQSFTRASRNLRPGDDYDTYDRSLEDPTSPRVARATSLICGLPCHPCPGGNSDTRDTQYDTDTETAVESDDDCETAIGSDSDNYISVEDTDSDLEDDIGSDEDLYQPLLEILYRSYSDDQREKLMKAIFVDQLVTKARIDPRRDLKGLCGSGYARELAEGIGKQLALKVDGLSTTAILDTALNRQQEWSRPLSSIEQSIILQEDLDQANKALRESRRGTGFPFLSGFL
ncbi:hypothetical protein CDV31_016754 [Fusarium ambrosium]|uniref:Uncharacterized protein n=1 Tax=Fusarium ambrosium TaxID=131363 RepID=A0A428S2L1_9HYPO|nr:hypothetical protein CDV31_016754 [Fusarium ambrosium]